MLHGIIAVNSFISILNPEVCSTCPFCSKKETVFHVFVLIDFKFYKAMEDLLTFEIIWCSQGAVCTIFEGNLVFSL